MLHRKLSRPLVACILLGCLHTSRALATSLIIQSLPAGYTSFSLVLGQPFADTVAVDPSVQNRLYAAVGFFGNESILRVDTTLGTTSTVATGLGSIGGIALLSNGDLAITENGTSQTILRAHDLNADGDFLEPGELTELIAPILADSGFGFTGTQLAIAPSGNASSIPAGSLLLQTADGGTSGEVLVVQNPTSAPAYRPAGGAYFSGLDYNGGIAFDSAGNLVVGESVYPNGRIYGLVNTNVDDHISSGESHILVDVAAIPNGIADLAVSQDGRVFFAGNQTTFGSGDAKIFAFQLPPDLLTGSGTPAPFATTNAAYISSTHFDDSTRNFTAGASVNQARLFVGGLDGTFTGFTNLVVITPTVITAINDWRLY